jgi:hypothetical protein
MGYRPPKGVRPPQLEGKRTGRPKGSRNYTSAWRDACWGYQHRNDFCAVPPTAEAHLWHTFASRFPDELGVWLEAKGLWSFEPKLVGMVRLLDDARWVVGHNEAADRTGAHRNLRRFMNEDFLGFMKYLTKLEVSAMRRRRRR